MDESRKKLRVCLIFLVIAAVVIGLIYYFTDVYGKNDVNDGTLVQIQKEINVEGYEIWQETA